MDYLIGIDIGTSATKIILFSEQGEVIDSVSNSYPLYQPELGYAEQEPMDWVQATKKGLKEIATKHAELVNFIAGISLSGQMHGLVLLDKNFNVLRKSIIWCDQRTQAEVSEMERLISKTTWLKITGNVPMTGLTAAKILWVKKNEENIYNKCAHLLLPKDFVRYAITGQIATEISDASGTQLLDVTSKTWSSRICDTLGIKQSILPNILKSTDQAGKISIEFSEETGLPHGLPVIAGAADQIASAIGNGIIKKGIISDTLGSSGVVFATSNKFIYDQAGRINTFCHAVKDNYALMGVTQACGISMKWLVDNFYTKKIHPYATIESDVANSKINQNIIFLPYLMGERTPILNANAKGILFGISGKTSRIDYARAVMEGISYSQYDAYKVLSELGIKSEIIKLSGGGAQNKIWMQMISDIFNVDVERNNVQESTILGAAIIAGVGTHVFQNWEEAVQKMITVEKRVTPNIDLHRIYQKKYHNYKELYTVNKKLMNDLG